MKLLATLAIAAPLVFLPSCGSNVINPQTIQAACVTACSFVPTIASIADLIKAGAGTSTVAQIAEAICSAFNASQQTLNQRLGAPAGVGTMVTLDVLLNGQVVKVTGTVTG